MFYGTERSLYLNNVFNGSNTCLRTSVLQRLFAVSYGGHARGNITCICFSILNGKIVHHQPKGSNLLGLLGFFHFLLSNASNR